jgi:hypothetical protein
MYMPAVNFLTCLGVCVYLILNEKSNYSRCPEVVTNSAQAKLAMGQPNDKYE